LVRSARSSANVICEYAIRPSRETALVSNGSVTEATSSAAAASARVSRTALRCSAVKVVPSSAAKTIRPDALF
jgi:hypothetical protein